MKKLVALIALLALLALLLTPGLAQDDDTGTTDGPQSTVQFFIVICESTAVVNFTGTMQAGYDIYYQIYSGSGGTGTELTSLRRVQVNGEYAVSEVVSYNGGTVASGAIGSALVSIAVEGAPNNTVYSDFVDDIQDGCQAPQNTTQTSTDTGSTASSGTSSSSGVSSGGILTPFGGVLDTPGSGEEPLVVIGARESASPLRTDNPGLLFAECDQYPDRAAPGLIYDSDNVRIFWSWFARTPEQINEHVNAAQYAVTLNRAPLPYIDVSPVQQINGLYWVFYTVGIGNLTPGTYGVEYKLSWDREISDGFESFGPGTGNQLIESSCTFTVQANPFGSPVDYNLMYSLRDGGQLE